MRAALIIISLVIIYFGLELGIFWYRADHSPKLVTPDQTEKSLGSGPALRYIAAGDSTAVGYGASSLEKTYTYQIAEYLSKTNTVDYENIGVIGAKTSDVLQTQISQIIAFKPDVVTISIGANDATHLVSSDAILNNYKTIIAELEKKTSAQIYITDIPNFRAGNLLPWFYINLLEVRSEKLNPQIIALTDARTKIVNIHDFGIYQHPKAQIYYAADGFHPNDLGYKNWANAFISKIQN